MVLESLPGWELVIFLILVGLFLLAGGIFAFVLLSRVRWPYKVSILQDFGNGKSDFVGNDRARLVAFGDGGEEIFRLKKRKKLRGAYGKRIGKNYIAWSIAPDGYWYNITFEGVNKKLLEVGISPVDKDARLANASIRKGIDKRYSDKTFAEKWGVTISIILIIIAIVVSGVNNYLSYKWSKDSSAANLEAAKANKDTADSNRQLVVALDNLKGNSGLK